MERSGEVPSQPARKPSRSTRWLVYLTVAVVIVLDQATKWVALDMLYQQNITKPLLGNFLTLHVIFNSGAALSFLEGHTWVVALFSLVLTVLLGLGALRVTRVLVAMPLALVFAGGVGNLIDRLIVPPYWGSGHVIDFIDYNGWFVGNVADIFIVVGVVWILFLLFKGVPFPGMRASEPGEVAARKTLEGQKEGYA